MALTSCRVLDLRPLADPVAIYAEPGRSGYDAAVRSRSLALLVLALLGGCGAATAEAPAEETTLEAPATDSAAFLLEVGGTLAEVLTEPPGTMDGLEAVRRQARGVDRLRAQRDLARAHLFAAMNAADARAQRGHYREMNELTTTSTRVRDAGLSADLDFLALWAAWRAGQRNADGRAQRFIDHHATSPDLVLIAWIIRGEIAFADHHWDDAAEGFRAVLGRLGHPLYAFALYRSAAVWREQQRDDDARQALIEVRDLGCASSASPATVHIALAATHALGETTAADASGRERPASCPEEGSTSPAGPLEDERPPVLQ